MQSPLQHSAETQTHDSFEVILLQPCADGVDAHHHLALWSFVALRSASCKSPATGTEAPQRWHKRACEIRTGTETHVEKVPDQTPGFGFGIGRHGIFQVVRDTVRGAREALLEHAGVGSRHCR